MLDDEMKKQGVTENSGDWGSLRLFCLAFKHPATPSFVFPPGRFFTHSCQVEGCVKVFYFSSLQGSLPAGTSQIEIVLLPNIPKWPLWFFFFLPWGFLGSLLSVKTPYVGFNSGHMLCAASVVPASVSSSALSAGDDSVACFAFCSCSKTGFVQIQHLSCSFPLSLCLCPHTVSTRLWFTWI